MNNDEKYMSRCIGLAKNGKGNVSPNPMVGCVIVHNNIIIGEGYHHKHGDNHAEVVAINQVKDKSKLKASTLYVSLEPCSHHGKTPPCSDYIIKNNIFKVVIGCKDSSTKVNGKGIQTLIDAGIEVKLGILENKCRLLNKRFFTFHEKKRPFIILKWAETKDGYIDIKRTDSNQGIAWITNKDTKLLTHKLRAQEDAILVGRRTIENDNPSLNTRHYNGSNPSIFIIDTNLKLEHNYKIFQSDVNIFNIIKSETQNKIEYIKLNADNFLKDLLSYLYNNKIQSIIIEGGKTTLNSFIKTNYWDKAKIITGNTYFEEGIESPKINKVPSETYTFADDTINIYRNNFT